MLGRARPVAWRASPEAPGVSPAHRFVVTRGNCPVQVASCSCVTQCLLLFPPPKKKPVKFSAWGWGPAVLFPQLAWLVDGGCPSPWDDGDDSDGGSIPITKEHIGEILGNLWESLETSFPHRLQTISHRPTALVGPGRTQPKGASPRSCAPEEKQQKYACSWQQQGNKKGVRM